MLVTAIAADRDLMDKTAAVMIACEVISLWFHGGASYYDCIFVTLRELSTISYMTYNNVKQCRSTLHMLATRRSLDGPSRPPLHYSPQLPEESSILLFCPCLSRTEGFETPLQCTL